MLSFFPQENHLDVRTYWGAQALRFFLRHHKIPTLFCFLQLVVGIRGHDEDVGRGGLSSQGHAPSA